MNSTRKRRLLWSYAAVVWIAAASWVTYREVIAPLKDQRAAGHRRIEELGEQFEKASQQARAVRIAGQGEARTVPGSNEEVDISQRGSAAQWFPDYVSRHFAHYELAAPQTRMNSTIAEPALPDYDRSYWAVEMPIGPGQVNGVLAASATLEKSWPLIRLLDFQIHHDADNAENRFAVCNVMVLARKPQSK